MITSLEEAKNLRLEISTVDTTITIAIILDAEITAIMMIANNR